MAYIKQTWRNAGAAQPTPLVASRFNHMENGIEAAHSLYESVKHGFRILGFVDDIDNLPDTDDYETGDGYIVDKKFFVCDGEQWVDNGYIRGPQGPRGEPGDHHSVGGVMLFAGDEPPEGWLLCDGSSALKSEYPVLASVIDGLHGSSSYPDRFMLPHIPPYHGVNFIIKT